MKLIHALVGQERDKFVQRQRFTRGPSAILLMLAASSVCSVSVSATSASRAGSQPPPGVAEDWSRGVWKSSDKTYFYSGFKDEGEYEDPNAVWKNPPPLTPEYLAQYNEIRQAAIQGRNIYDKGANCSPLGMPFMAGFGLMEILFKQGQVAIVFEEDGGVRRIFTDGRPHPAGADLIPSYNGHSVGHWKGKTLIVDTVGIRDDTFIEVGMPHSDQIHVIERWTQVGPDELTNDVTIIDPKALTKPWGKTWHWKRHGDWSINEVFCINSRDATIDGATTLLGPDGKPLLGPNQKKDVK